MEVSSYVAGLPGLADSADVETTVRPFSPTDRLASSTTANPGTAEAPSGHEETDSIHEDGQIHSQDNGYSSSASSTQQSSGNSLRGGLDDDELSHLNSRASSRSSVSSVPASTLIHLPDGVKSAVATAMYDPYTCAWTGNGNTNYERPEWLGKSVHTLRQREAAFRNPSSVRAMQMHTEDEDDEYLTPTRRREAQRKSDISLRSAGSPLKRSPYYSPTGSGGKEKVKKEYPLVLLHCSLLPPSLPLPNGVGVPSPKVLKEILPPQYWRRWRLLVEKVGSGVLRDRGVLISHPQDAYDLLEERLLESLELQRPRLDRGHFLGQETDSEKEDCSSKEGSATDDEQGEQCPDCGGRVVRGPHSDRKWEIKVFAANGLMKAGAWAAAWKEMEKVDVEVSLSLPFDVRRELEKRLLEDEKLDDHSGSQVPQQCESESGHHGSRVSDLGESGQHFQESFSAERETKPQGRPKGTTSTHNEQRVEEVDLLTLLINYVRVLASDRRNIAMCILSAAVLFLAIGSRTQTPGMELRPFPQEAIDTAPTMEVGMTHQPMLSLQTLASFTITSSEASAATAAESAEPTEVVVPPATETSDASTAPIDEKPGLSGEQEEAMNERVEPIEDRTTLEVTDSEVDGRDLVNGQD